MQIAFWLAKPIPLIEMIECRLSPFILSNAFLCLLVLDDQDWIQSHVHLCPEAENLKCTLLARKKGAAASIEKLLDQAVTPFSLRCIYYLIEKELMLGTSASLLAYLPRLHEVIKEDIILETAIGAGEKAQSFEPESPTSEAAFTNGECSAPDVDDSDSKSCTFSLSPIAVSRIIHFDALFIWIYLLNAKWKEAQELLERYPQEVLTDEYSPLYPLMGCWLQATEGVEIALTHFSGSMEVPYPSTTMLLSFFLRGKISEKIGWIATAFSYGKKWD